MGLLVRNSPRVQSHSAFAACAHVSQSARSSDNRRKPRHEAIKCASPHDSRALCSILFEHTFIAVKRCGMGPGRIPVLPPPACPQRNAAGFCFRGACGCAARALPSSRCHALAGCFAHNGCSVMRAARRRAVHNGCIVYISASIRLLPQAGGSYRGRSLCISSFTVCGLARTDRFASVCWSMGVLRVL